MRMRYFLVKVTFSWDYSSTAIAVPLPSQGKAFVCKNRLGCVSNIVCDDRLDGSSRAPTPTAFAKFASPPTLSEGQARKITPYRAVLARVRSEALFLLEGTCAEAVGRYITLEKFSVIQAPFYKRGLGESRAAPLSLLARSDIPIQHFSKNSAFLLKKSDIHGIMVKIMTKRKSINETFAFTS